MSGSWIIFGQSRSVVSVKKKEKTRCKNCSKIAAAAAIANFSPFCWKRLQSKGFWWLNNNNFVLFSYNWTHFRSLTIEYGTTVATTTTTSKGMVWWVACVHPKTFVNNGKFLMLKTCTSKLRMKLQIEVRNNSITKVLSTFSWFLLETESGFGGEKEKRGWWSWKIIEINRTSSKLIPRGYEP